MREFYDVDPLKRGNLVPLIVVRYIKGSDKPYVLRLARPRGAYEAQESRRSVTEIISWKAMIEKYANRYDPIADKIMNTGGITAVGATAGGDVCKDEGCKLCVKQNIQNDELEDVLDEIAILRSEMMTPDVLRKMIRSEMSSQDEIRETKLKALKEEAEKEEKTMKPELTLRQKVTYFALPKDERVLREAGFHDGSGALTEQGRRILMDVLWAQMTNADRKKVVEAVASTLPKEK